MTNHKTPGKRLVLFAGPHKSASSSVQEFLSRHASNKKRKHPALQNWTYPWIPRYKRYQSRKGFAPLVTEYYDNATLIQSIYHRIQEAWDEVRTPGGVIFGSEEFDRFGQTPWSHRNAMTSIREILELLKPKDFSVVINYRSPRSEQWISIWKQLTRLKGTRKPYRDFICQGDVKTWEYLDCVANPLGLAQAFLREGWKVHLIDMEGVVHDEKDVSHVLSCEILEVACNGGWLENLDQVVQNVKSRDPEITEEQTLQMEAALQRRDCSYQDNLLGNKGFQVYHRHSVWNHCTSGPAASYQQHQNTTYLLQLLQSHVGCGPLKQDEVQEASHLSEEASFEHPLKILNPSTHDNDSHLHQVAVMQNIVLSMALLVLLWILVRLLACHRSFAPRRR